MQVTVVKQGTRWIAQATYEQREIPKSAGFKWDRDHKCWYATDAEVAALLNDPEAQAKALALAKERETAKQAAIAESRASSSDVEIPVPEGLAYLPYQRAGIAFGLSHPNVLFGDEMGLGKTIQAIGILNEDAVLALKTRIRTAFEEISRLRHETAVAKVPHVIEHVGVYDPTGEQEKRYPASVHPNCTCKECFLYVFRRTKMITTPQPVSLGLPRGMFVRLMRAEVGLVAAYPTAQADKIPLGQYEWLACGCGSYDHGECELCELERQGIR